MANKVTIPTKVITGVNTRWSYANVWDPKSINGGAPKYSVSLIIPKSDTATVAKIKAAIKTGECTVDVSSAAKVVLSGAANKCTAEISSAAKFSAPEFQVARYAIDASSGSDASVHCTEELRAEASSGSSIEYKGDCSTDLSRSSGGSIRRK